MLQRSISVAPITQVTYMRNKNGNIQGRPLNAIKMIYHSIKESFVSFEILDVCFSEIFCVGNFRKILTKCLILFMIFLWPAERITFFLHSVCDRRHSVCDRRQFHTEKWTLNRFWYILRILQMHKISPYVDVRHMQYVYMYSAFYTH